MSSKSRNRIVDGLYDQVSEPDEPEEGEVSEMSEDDGQEVVLQRRSSSDHKKSKKKKKEKKKKKKRKRKSSGAESDTSPTKAKKGGSADENGGSTDREGGETPEVQIVDDYESKKKSHKDKKKKSSKKVNNDSTEETIDDHAKTKPSKTRQRDDDSPDGDSRGRRPRRQSPYHSDHDDQTSKGRRRNVADSPIRDDSRVRDRGERSRKRAATKSRSRSHSRDRSPGYGRKFRRRQDSHSPVAKRSREEKDTNSKRFVPPEDEELYRERSSKKPDAEEEIVGSSGALSLSIEETNKLRAKLGLKPLNLPGSGASKTDEPPENDNLPGTLIPNSTVRHLPALNITEKTHIEKMRDKLEQRRLKRQQEAKLLRVKTLGESDSDEESTAAWVKQQKKKITAKEEAEKRAKILADLDDEFGIKGIVEEEAKIENHRRYKSSDLRGLKVEHSADRFQDGSTIVLTLKDTGVLDEEAGDTLVNVNIMDNEKTERNLKNLRDAKLGGYNPYEEEIDEATGDLRSKGLLSKYDEEISGKESKKSFEIGRDGTFNEDEAMRQERERIRQRLKKTVIESLDTPALRIASDFYTAEESSTKFKKVKKKKVKRKILKADDLLPLGGGEPESGGIRRGRAPSPVPVAVDDDDFMNIKVDDEEDDFGLQKALAKTRRLKGMSLKEDASASRMADIASSMVTEETTGTTTNGAEFIGTFADDDTFDKNIILNETSEFCRNLGAWRASEISSGLGEPISKELLEFESSLKSRAQPAPARRGGWEEVVDNDSDEPMDGNYSGDTDEETSDKKKESFSILDNEVKLTGGLGAALKLAAAKGYLEGKGKEIRSSNLSHLSAKNYTVEDKMRDDDRSSRRDRYNGPTQAFSEKSGYVPNVKLEYIDDLGRNMNEKEAFRYLSHRFHGKGSGKMKTEKRMKKIAEETVLKGMSSTDTPLQTLQKLRDKQKESATPYIVLTGSKINPTDLRK